MRIHTLQHVPYEFLTGIDQWAQNRKHTLSRTLLPQDFNLPEPGEFDLLIILGGPMSVFEEERYPWLKLEKKFIATAIANDKIVLGICLGAQLLAEALGARVYKNRYKEIGWHSVSLLEAANDSPIFSRMPKSFTPLLWHTETFDIPQRCTRVAESAACANQAFIGGDRLIGLQFHIEPSIKSLQRVIACCGSKIGTGKYVQTPAEMLAEQSRLGGLNSVMTLLMEGLEKLHGHN